jgi:hypothetical protein
MFDCSWAGVHPQAAFPYLRIYSEGRAPVKGARFLRGLRTLDRRPPFRIIGGKERGPLSYPPPSRRFCF